MTITEARAALKNAEERGTPVDVEIARRELNKAYKKKKPRS